MPSACEVIVWCSLLSTCVILRYNLNHLNNVKQDASALKTASKRPFLLISLDGFRHDYIEIVKRSGAKLPNFDRFVREGARALHVENVFPTVTFVNHQAIMTGLYAESSGIVLNSFPDSRWPDYNDWFNWTSQRILNMPRYFDGKPDPAWASMERAGVKTSSILWPYTDAHFNGQLPFVQVGQYYILTHPGSEFPFEKRVNMTVDWLANNKKYGVNFATLYFEEPDETGHAYGPFSQEIRDVVVDLDAHLGSLLKQLEARGLLDSMNIVLTADHGMAEIQQKSADCKTCIFLDDYVANTDWFDLLMDTCGGPIYPKAGREDQIYNALKDKHPKLQVWRKTDPEAKKLHYQNNVNIPPIYAQPEWPFTVYKNRPKPGKVHVNEVQQVIRKARGQLSAREDGVAGTHGYPPSFSDMWPVWIGRGPAFKKNFSMSSRMESVDLYPLMMNLMGLQPNPNNGSVERLKPLLKPEMWSQLNHSDADAGYCLFPELRDCGLTFLQHSVSDLAMLCLLVACCISFMWVVRDLQDRWNSHMNTVHPGRRTTSAPRYRVISVPLMPIPEDTELQFEEKTRSPPDYRP